MATKQYSSLPAHQQWKRQAHAAVGASQLVHRGRRPPPPSLPAPPEDNRRRSPTSRAPHQARPPPPPHLPPCSPLSPPGHLQYVPVPHPRRSSQRPHPVPLLPRDRCLLHLSRAVLLARPLQPRLVPLPPHPAPRLPRSPEVLRARFQAQLRRWSCCGVCRQGHRAALPCTQVGMQ